MERLPSWEGALTITRQLLHCDKNVCHGSTGSPLALSEEDSKRGRDGSRGGKGSS